MKKKALLCLAAGESQLLLIKGAKKIGYSIIAIDQNPNAPGFKLADVSIILSTYEPNPIIIELKKYLEEFNFVGILNRSSGFPVITGAIIAEEFKISSYPKNSGITVLNKHLLFEKLKNTEVNIPKYFLLQRPENKRIHPLFPVIVKPSLSLVGKSGISVVSDASKLDIAINKAFKATTNNQVIIQEYINGIDVALVSFVQKKKLYPVCFIEEINYPDKTEQISGVGVVIPARISKSTENEIIQISKLIVKKLNIDTSPFMISFRVENNIPYLMEIHLDFGGDLILDALLPHSLNFNIVEFGIRLMGGEDVITKPVKTVPVAILYYPGKELNRKRKFLVIKNENFSTESLMKKFKKKYEELYL